MPKKTIPLTDLVPLLRQMTQRKWEDGKLRGVLLVADQSMANVLAELLDEDNADDYPCTVVRGDPDRVQPGNTFELAFGPVRGAIGLIAQDIPALLRNGAAATGTGDRAWYVVSDDVASWETESELHRRLTAVHRLLKALEGAASIFDQRKRTMVFLHNGRFDVPIEYNEEALFALDLDAATELTAALSLEDGHAEQRHQICATAIRELLAAVALGERFSALLRQMPELVRRFVDGYRLFASAFSYEKVRDQTEALRIEYTGKIHKTISDIQGQLLGIPISTIVIATQFKPSAQAAGQAWVNLAIVFGAVIFFVLFVLAVWNQWQTLSVIDTEIDRHEAALRKDNAPIADRLDNVFKTLSNRVLLQRIVLCVAVAFCFLGLCVGFAVYRQVDGA